ncbi:MAG: hypothetical protein HYV26_18760 [Candidatus Hydrogenedentes bacterium]|nr:hypothetical protein [Candidatus Hydrogenedentota bacterium]
MTETKVTRNHEEIQRWVEEREGKPGKIVPSAHDLDAPTLHIDFPGHSGGEGMEEMEWAEWFRVFDEADLAFVYKDDTPTGEQSPFCKVVDHAKACDYD